MTSLAIVVNHTDKRDLPVAGQLTDVNALLPSTSIDWPVRSEPFKSPTVNPDFRDSESDETTVSEQANMREFIETKRSDLAKWAYSPTTHFRAGEAGRTQCSGYDASLQPDCFAKEIFRNSERLEVSALLPFAVTSDVRGAAVLANPRLSTS